MLSCPNKNLPEWKELVEAIGEDFAYHVWDVNNGYPLNKTKDGKSSDLYHNIEDFLLGDKVAAIQAKAKMFTKEFYDTYKGDFNEQGEPITIHYFNYLKGDFKLMEHSDYEKYGFSRENEESGYKAKASVVIQNIANNLIDPIFRNVVDKLVDNISKNDVDIKFDLISKPQAFAIYDPKSNDISISAFRTNSVRDWFFQETMIHEILHSLTVSSNSKTFGDEMQKVYEYYKENAQSISYNMIPAFENWQEFVAYLGSNKKFYQEIKKIDAQQRDKTKGIIRRIIQSIRRFLGLEPTVDNTIRRILDFIENDFILENDPQARIRQSFPIILPSNLTNDQLTTQKILQDVHDKFALHSSEKYYVDKDGKEYKRVSTLIDEKYPSSVFKGDSFLYEDNRNWGNAIDAVLTAIIDEENTDDIGNRFGLNINQNIINKLHKRLSQIKNNNPNGIILSQLQIEYDDVVGTADIIIINPDGSIKIYDIKSSWDSTVQPNEKNISYDNDPRGYTTKKEKHTRQLNAYSHMFEKNGIKVESINIIPFFIEQADSKNINKVVPEPLIDISFRNDIQSKLFPSEKVNIPNYVPQSVKKDIGRSKKQLHDMMNKLVVNIEERISRANRTIVKKEDRVKVVSKLKAIQKLLTDENINEIQRLDSFVQSTHKTLVESIYPKFLSLSKNVDRQTMSELIDYYNFAAQLEDLDDVSPIIMSRIDPNYQVKDGDDLSLAEKYHRSIEARNEILRQYKESVRPIIAKILAEQADPEANKKLDEYVNKRISRIQNTLSNRDLSDKKRKQLESELNKLKKIGTTDGDSILEELKIVDQDISLIQRWTEPMISVSDDILSLFAKFVKNTFEKVRKQSIEHRNNFVKEINKFRKATGKSRIDSAKFNEGLYETISEIIVKANSDGTYDVKEIEYLAFVNQYDTTEYNKAKAKMYKKYNKYILSGDLSKAKAIRSIFYSEWHTESISKEDALQEIHFKEIELKNNAITREEFDSWVMSVLWDKDSRNLFSTEYKKEDEQYMIFNEDYTSQYVNELIKIIKKTNDISLYTRGFWKTPNYKTNKKYTKMYDSKDNPKTPEGEYHKFLTDQYLKTQELLPESMRHGLKLPPIRKGTKDRFIENGLSDIVERTKERTKELFSNSPDDLQELGYKDYTTGTLKVVPFLYDYNLPISEISVDLASSVLRYIEAAERYKATTEMMPTAMSALALVKDREIIKTNTKGESIMNKFADKLGIPMPVTKINENRAAELMEAFLDKVFFLEYKKKWEVDTPFGPLRMDKAIDNLMSFASLTQIGGNPLLGLANSLMGNTQVMIESIAGEYFTKRSWLKAQAKYMTYTPDFVNDFMKPQPESFIGQLIDRYDPMQGNFTDKFGKKINHTAAKKLFSRDVWYMTMSEGERNIQVTTMLALLMDTKIDIDGKQLSLLNMYELNENGRLVTKEGLPEGVEEKVQNRLHAISKRLHGVYNSFDKADAHRYTLGRLLLMYRNFVVSGFRKRYKKFGKDQELGGITEGTYRTLGRLLVQEFNELSNFITFQQHNLSEFEVANARRALLEIGISISLLLLAKGLTSLELDDDDIIGNVLLYSSLRLYREMSFFYNPGQFSEIVSTPTVLYSVIKKAGRLSNQLFFDPFGEYERDTGIFDKGDSKLWARFLQLFGVSGYNVDPDYAVEVLMKLNN